MELIERMARAAGAHITAHGLGDMCIGDMDDAEFRSLMGAILPVFERSTQIIFKAGFDLAISTIRKSNVVVPREPTEAMLRAYWESMPSPYELDMEGDASALRHLSAIFEDGEVKG